MSQEPGVPVADFIAQSLCGGIAFHCQACCRTRVVPVAAVVARLETLGLDPSPDGRAHRSGGTPGAPV